MHDNIENIIRELKDYKRDNMELNDKIISLENVIYLKTSELAEMTAKNDMLVKKISDLKKDKIFTENKHSNEIKSLKVKIRREFLQSKTILKKDDFTEEISRLKSENDALSGFLQQICKKINVEEEIVRTIIEKCQDPDLIKKITSILTEEENRSTSVKIDETFIEESVCENVPNINKSP